MGVSGFVCRCGYVVEGTQGVERWFFLLCAAGACSVGKEVKKTQGDNKAKATSALPP